MSLVTLRAAIVTRLKEEFGEQTKVEPHGGPFNEGEIRRVASLAQPAALFVVFLGIVPEESNGTTYNARPRARFGVFVVARDNPAQQKGRGDVMLAMTSRLLTILSIGTCWGMAEVDASRYVGSENLSTGDIDSLGIALSVVTWDQRVTLSLDEAGELADFLTFNAAHVPPAPEETPVAERPVLATDTVTLSQEET